MLGKFSVIIFMFNTLMIFLACVGGEKDKLSGLPWWLSG